MFLLYLGTLLIIWLLHTYWSIRKLPPGPWGMPVLGYLPWLDPKAPYVTLTNIARKYGGIYSLSLGSVRTVVLSDPKLIRKLFAKDSTTGRAPLYLTHGIMNGYGLICAEGDLWKDQRKFVHNFLRNIGGTKIGHQRKDMEQLILKHVRELVNHLKAHSRQPIDPLEPLRHSIGSVINEIVFGTHWPREDETWQWLQELQEEGTKLIGVAGPLNFLPFLRFLPSFKRPMGWLIEGKLKTHRLYQKLINKQTIILGDYRLPSDAHLDTDTIRYTNLIQGFLLERQKKRNTKDFDKFYNDQQFYHLLADVFGAGLDTTLTTLRWFVLYMALNPDIQRQVRKQIHDVIGDFVSMDEIGSLPLVEACIAETQRIRSVVPVGIPHGAIEDIFVDGYTIPKGSMIVPLQWAVHMNTDQYVQPEIFNPQHFLNDEGMFCKNEYFIPFQNGKRMCVGDELARMLLFLFAVSLLQQFELSMVDGNADLMGKCGITLTPEPYKIMFKCISTTN